MTQRSPFRCFKTSPEVIRLAVMLYVRFPLSLRNVGDLLHERGIEVSHETVRFWWRRVGLMFAAEIRRRRVSGKRASRWRCHLDEIGLGLLGLGLLLTEWLDVLGLSAWTVAVLIAVAALERLLLRSDRAAVQGIK
jgi:hypothetical protein